jgi:hypothetical protein
MEKETKSRTLEQVLEDTCRRYRGEPFSSYQVYSDILEYPKKNGRRRHYTLTYSQVKQRMARASYLEKLETSEDSRVAIYKNRCF